MLLPCCTVCKGKALRDRTEKWNGSYGHSCSVSQRRSIILKFFHLTATTRTFQTWVRMLQTPDESTKIIVLSFLDDQDKTEVEENRLIVTTVLIPCLLQTQFYVVTFRFPLISELISTHLCTTYIYKHPWPLFIIQLKIH